MPTNSSNTAWRGNWAQRAGRAFVDRILPGNQRGADGTLTNVGRGALGLAGTVGLNLLMPGAGTLAKPLIANTVNNGNPVNFDGSTSVVGRWIDALQHGGGSQPGVNVRSIPNTGVPDVNFGINQLGAPVLNGSYTQVNGAGIPRFSFDTSPRATQISDVGIATPTANYNQSFRGADGRTYTSGGAVGRNAVASGVGKGGAGVITGDAARDFMQAMKESALAAERQAGGDTWGHRYSI